MRVLSGIRRIMVILGMIYVFGFITAAAPAFAGGEPEVYVGYESFTWKEFDDFNGRLLKESGPRYEVGFAYSHEFPDHITLKPRIEVFGGDVDYKGQACDIFGNCVPDNTTTRYVGYKFEFDLGGKIRTSKTFALEPFAGIGFRYWARDIKDSILPDGTFVVGYTEHWTTLYGRLGLRGDLYFARKSRVFFEAGAKLPISTSNYINDPNVSYQSITLKPGNQTSFFAEVGVKLHVFKISAFYDSMRFKKSPIVYENDPFFGLVGFLQPKSTSDIYGVRVGAAF